MKIFCHRAQKYLNYCFILNYKPKQPIAYGKIWRCHIIKRLNFFQKKKKNNFMKKNNSMHLFLCNRSIDFFFYKFCINIVIKIFQIYLSLKIVRKNKSNSFQFKREFVLFTLN